MRLSDRYNVIGDDEDYEAFLILCEPAGWGTLTQWEARCQLMQSFENMLDNLVGGEYDKHADKNPEIL